MYQIPQYVGVYPFANQGPWNRCFTTLPIVSMPNPQNGVAKNASNPSKFKPCFVFFRNYIRDNIVGLI